MNIHHYYGNHGNTTDSNHGSGSHLNEDIKVFKKHRVSDHLYTIILSTYGQNHLKDILIQLVDKQKKSSDRTLSASL